jgi:hypothetical protein
LGNAVPVTLAQQVAANVATHLLKADERAIHERSLELEVT